MPVAVFSGLPGAGKTAQMVARMLEYREKFPERPLFYMGINGLVDGMATELTMHQLEHWWEELPVDSVIFLDEAQEDHLMPKDGGNPKEWVKRIRKVRHEGMDFVLSCQHPCDLSTSVRRLVDEHIHTVRKFKTGVIEKYRWGRCVETPEKESTQKAAQVSAGLLPKKVFDLYKSSNSHNMKAKLPFRLYLFIALVVAAVVLIAFLPHTLKHVNDVAKPQAQDASVDPKNVRDEADTALRQKDYGQWMKPRVEGIPWTAPAFDKLEVKAEPRLYCIAVDDGRCGCMTEQGTTYEVPVSTCRTVAANGLYNPFAPPIAGTSSGGVGRREPAATKPQAAAPAPDDADGSSGRERATAKAYVPPTYAAWNSDPFGGSKR